MKNRFLASLLIIAMLLVMLPITAAADGVTGLSGSGTASDPYLINNIDDLVWFRNDVNADNTYEGMYVKLTADIDLTDKIWTPIGTSNYDKTPTAEGVKMFAGNFDGGNHTITGLSSDGYVPDSAETGSTEYSFGLFGYVYGANISNVKFANVDIDCGTRNDSAGNKVYGSGIAALIGYYVPANEKTTVISNCHVLNGTVKASNNMGGLIGHMDSQLSQPEVDITIENCSNAADVTTEAREAGGILGLMNSAREDNYYVTMRGTVTFKNCVNTGDITSLGDGAPSAGGILGRDHNQAAGQRLKIIFDGCKNSGTITVTASGETHAAGIGSGYYSAGAWLIAKDCENTGNVVVNNPISDVYAGGLISYGGVVELINSTSTGTVTGGIGNKYVGGAQNILFLEGMTNFTDTVNGYTYYLNGGTSPEYAALVDDAAGGGNFHLVETAYKDGAEFGGWYDNAQLTGEAYTALSSSVKTYYAKWNECVAKIGTKLYADLKSAVSEAKSKDTIVLLADVGLDDTIAIEKSITIDGNGHILSPKEADKTYNSAIMAGNSGWGDDHGETITLKNIKFNNWTVNYGVVRAQGVTLLMDGCEFNKNTVKNAAYGVLSLNFVDATVENTKFDQNSSRAIDINYNGDKSNAVVKIDNCEFTDNTSSGAGIVVRNDGSKVSVTNSRFIGNTVDTTGNAAVLYVGWGTEDEVTGNLFKDNSVTTAEETTKRFASAVFCDGCSVNGNVFDNNTATRNGENISTSVAVGAFYGAADVSGNYWGGNEPEAGTEYTIEYTRNPVTQLDYYTEYNEDEDGRLTLSGKKIGANAVVGIGDKYFSTISDAIDAAKSGEIIDLYDDAEEEILLPNGVSLNKNGYDAKVKVVDEKGKEVKTYTVTFNVVPADAEISVTAYEGDTIIDHGDGKYTLVADCNYSYSVSKEGYTTKTGSIKSDKDITVDVMLVKELSSTEKFALAEAGEDIIRLEDLKDTAAFDAALEVQSMLLLQSGSFVDVAKSDWFYSDVTALISKGVINGYPDGSFRPQGVVTWGEALKLVMKAVGYGDIEAANGHWASGYMDMAVEKGLIPGEVELDAAITRGEIADLTALALKLGEAKNAAPFADEAPVSAAALYEVGIIKGSLDNGQLLYRAESTITRAEMAAIIWRVYCAR